MAQHEPLHGVGAVSRTVKVKVCQVFHARSDTTSEGFGAQNEL